jgi:hypothetical protein
LEALSCALARTAILHQGDPGILGWLTVAVYAVAALACLAVGLRARSAAPSGIAERGFWLLAALLLVFVAANKQLDLHILFSKSMRCFAQQNGWTDEARRAVQQKVIICIAIAALTIGGLLVASMRRHLGQVWPALLGLAIVVGFTFMRAAAFNKLDGPLHALLANDIAKSIIELCGPVVILVAASPRLRKVQTQS